MDKNSLIKQTLIDIYLDIQELLYLLTHPLNLLKHAQSDSIGGQLLINALQIKQNLLELQPLLTDAKDVSKLKELIEAKHKIKQKIRLLYKLAVTIASQTEWQSPTFFNSSAVPMSGSLSGTIRHTLNDYKRDQHATGKAYEQKFEKEYLNKLPTQQFKSLLTNSGMAAFSTIINCLHSKGFDRVIMGENTYFEVKYIVRKMFNQVEEFKESHLNDLINEARIPNTLIIIDSLSNSPTPTKPNSKMVNKIISKLHEKSWLIVDNTGDSFKNPLLGSLITPNNTVFFESLNKYHQFGMDLTNAGIMYMHKMHYRDFFKTRVHFGSNLSDFATLLLPTPSKKNLNQRLGRISRNIQHLHQNMTSSNTKLKLSDLPINSNGFISPYFVIYNHPALSLVAKKKLINKLYQHCQKKNIPIAGGSSFGLDISRIYLTALSQSPAFSFIRISPGIETMIELDKLTNGIKEIIEHAYPKNS